MGCCCSSSDPPTVLSLPLDHIRCADCWKEDGCDHWVYDTSKVTRLNSIQDSGLFTWERDYLRGLPAYEQARKARCCAKFQVVRPVVHPRCKKCVVPAIRVSNRGIYNGHTEQCPTCKTHVVVAPHAPSDDDMFDGFTKCPRAFCRECKGTGEIHQPHFIACTNCAGTGGTTCTACNGKKQTIRSSSQRIDTFDDIQYVNTTSAYPCQTCRGVGFLLKCHLCDGRRAI